MSENSINNIIDSTPLLAKIIEKDLDAAKAHLDSHVTTEEQILTLDKNCEYCQIYFKEQKQGYVTGYTLKVFSPQIEVNNIIE